MELILFDAVKQNNFFPLKKKYLSFYRYCGRKFRLMCIDHKLFKWDEISNVKIALIFNYSQK